MLGYDSRVAFHPDTVRGWRKFLIIVFSMIGILTVLNWSIGVFADAGNYWLIEERKIVIFNRAEKTSVIGEVASTEMIEPSDIGEKKIAGADPIQKKLSSPELSGIENKIRKTFPEQSEKALSVFRCESGLDPMKHSGVDVMSDGRAFSIGVAQINLTVSSIAGVDCPKAFIGKNNDAVVVDEKLYQACVTLAENEDYSLETARKKYDGRGNWTAWKYCDLKTS